MNDERPTHAQLLAAYVLKRAVVVFLVLAVVGILAWRVWA